MMTGVEGEADDNTANKAAGNQADQHSSSEAKQKEQDETPKGGLAVLRAPLTL